MSFAPFAQPADTGSEAAKMCCRVPLTITIGISVDKVEAACERLESLNVNWKKRLTDGRMKNVAFVLDPDGYWIEIVQNERFAGQENF